MTTTDLPSPRSRSRITSGGVDIHALQDALDEAVDGEIRFDDGSRATYSTDASNYRQVPIAVVVPHTIDAAVETIRVCHDQNVPVLNRGGGTSLAGQCCNAAVVIDWTKYCNAVVSVDADASKAVVEPGITLDSLNAAVAQHGLMYGPKPATHSHCTLGGMMGNNSCGSSAQAFGKTVDNVLRLEVLTYDGVRMWVGETSDEEYQRIIALGGRRAEIYAGARKIITEYADEIRDKYPRIPRRVSGYNLDSLLPDNGFNLAQALIGSESTLVTILRAEVKLVPAPTASTFVVLGFPTIADAGDAASAIATHDPLTIEGLDETVIRDERTERKNSSALQLLPDGDAWLLIEMPGADKHESDARAFALLDELGQRDVKPNAKIFDDTDQQHEIMAMREAALGAAARVPGQPDAWSGWEDAAVPPERLGDYLRDFRALLLEYGYKNVALYGHFGQGCVHARIPFELTTAPGVADFRSFIDRAARLVVSYGGSLSGEHGDGQSRAALLPIMFGDRLIHGFEQFKAVFDAGNRMNPGKMVHPNQPTQNLRLGPGYGPPASVKLQFSYPDDDGRFDRAALRCVGVGNCRSHSGGVMCPSYRATGEEEHSTRGRARLLFEMLDGQYRDSPITKGWRSTEVKDALDLCLSCKGCKSDCPVDVDMATYKAEFLSHHYAGRIRPPSHYTMGWLPRWARLVHKAPQLFNRLSHTRLISRLGKRLGGIEPARPVPWFAADRFVDWFAARPEPPAAPLGDVLLWPDSFTNNFHPAIARAAVVVLEDAGYRVVIPHAALCCGLTWISTGQLKSAKRILQKTAEELAGQLRGGMRMVCLEPSCTAVFRSDAPELLPKDENIALVRDQTRTLAELLCETTGWVPPRIEKTALVQPHCHQHAVLGFDADQRVMDRVGITATTIGGCCGLAGNFGFEAGHLDVSVACAEHELLPAVHNAAQDTVVLADGFSCRTQLEQTGNGRQAVHLAELLAAGLRGERLGQLPEQAIMQRPGRPERIPARILSQAKNSLPSRRT
ncbi:MAG TPA: FAD-binding and (Fe-S)-binding domain-containing protein [Microbacteriaceae bacterium]|nr:FAD-binding and (Fe-S)-binding domain-containing protein [Microbacteriaceae bacterium]